MYCYNFVNIISIGIYVICIIKGVDMLDIDMEFKKGILIVRLKGKLDNETSFVLDNDLRCLILNNVIKYLLLNVTNLDYIDERGFGVIKNNYFNILKNNGKMLICGFDKVLDYNINLNNTFYQIKSEEGAYQLIQI